MDKKPKMAFEKICKRNADIIWTKLVVSALIHPNILTEEQSKAISQSFKTTNNE